MIMGLCNEIIIHDHRYEHDEDNENERTKAIIASKTMAS